MGRWNLRQTSGILRGIAVLTVALIITMVSDAIDPSLPESQVTRLGITDTVNGITATLDTGYADVFRSSVTHSITYNPKAYTLGGMATIQLALADGTVLPPLRSVGGGGGGGGSADTRTTSNTYNVDTSGIEGTPETIDLVLTVTYGGENAPAPMAPPPMPEEGNAESQGGGGGGGGGASAPPAQNADPAPERTFSFEFSLPLYAATAIDGTQQASDRDVTFTTQNVRVAPSVTKFELCHEGLDALNADDGSWIVDLMLDDASPNGTALFIMGESMSPDIPTEAGCYEAQAFIPYEGTAESLVIQPKFMQSLPKTEETATAIEEEFAEMGIVLDVEIIGNDAGWTLMVDNEATEFEGDPMDYHEVIAGYPFFQDELDADWSMTFELP